jgi:hypothetical protein
MYILKDKNNRVKMVCDDKPAYDKNIFTCVKVPGRYREKIDNAQEIHHDKKLKFINKKPKVRKEDIIKAKSVEELKELLLKLI